MRTLSVLIFSALFLVGCAHDLTNPSVIERIAKNAYDERGSIRPNYAGWVKSHHDSGELAKLAHYFGPKLDGPYMNWRRNGQKSAEGSYIKNRLISFVTWKPDGPMADSRVVDGKGIIKTYHDNGIVAAKITHEGGYRTGKAVWWHDNGEVAEETHYIEGKRVGPHVYRHKNGQMAFTVSYQDDLRQGPATWRWDSGIKKAESTFQNDVLHGAYRYWYKNGSDAYTASFDKGDLVDYSIQRPNGDKYIDQVRDGHGKRVMFYMNGAKSYEAEYAFGKLHGIVKWWRNDGSLKAQARYRNGEVFESKSVLEDDLRQRSLNKLGRQWGG